MLMEILFLFVGMAVGAIAAWLIATTKHQTKKLLDVEKISSLQRELDFKLSEIKQQMLAIDELNRVKGTREAEITYANEKNKTHAETENRLIQDIAVKQNQISNLEKRNISFETEIDPLKKQRDDLLKENIRFANDEAQRIKKYEYNVIELNKLKEMLEKQHLQIQQEREEEIRNKYEQMKQTWARHQEDVKLQIQTLCKKHTIKYVDKVPFKGSPDNTVSICEEYVIFDAKSPANENLENFPSYIIHQVEQAKKYAKQEGVKKDIFLVIPKNSLDVLENFSWKLPDYNVYAISIDALEPILLSLKKIEEYEFLEQLSPEERDNICRIIGKFAHATKRKIQIDQFFTQEFLDILSRCKSDLPADVLNQVIEYEKADKLNPPVEKRQKQILTKDLVENSERLKLEAKAKGVEMDKLPFKELTEGEYSSE